MGSKRADAKPLTATITDLEAKVEEYTKKVAAGHKAKET